jgi:uncharacterized protein
MPGLVPGIHVFLVWEQDADGPDELGHGRLRNLAKNSTALSDSAPLIRPWDGTSEREPFMAKMIFVNLPVSDLARATAFYQAIGATRNEQFSDHTASCMVFSDTIHTMLLTHDKFRQFTPKTIADAKTSSEVLICISAESRDAVDDMVGKAKGAGGVADPSPKQDFGFMYGRSFEDPDGHIWEVMWMDAEAASKTHSATAAA